jgi:hypothetical protein
MTEDKANQAAETRKGEASGAAQALEDQAVLSRSAKQVAFDFLVNGGLYSTLDTTLPVGAAAELEIRYTGGYGFDAYCIGCRRETTFRVTRKEVPTRGIGGPYAANATAPSLFAVNALCQRDWTVYTYIFLDGDKKLTKVGQHPSVAEIALGELRTIDKALDAVDRRELGKALGLFSHDSALGAFAYLRRVFERMIDRAHQRQAHAGQAIAGFAELRMDQRIAALKTELPDMVVRNSGVFSILSLGLHELTEEQCTSHFPVIKAVLFQMLEQEEHKRKAALTQRDTEAALQRILNDPKGEGA